MPTVSVAKAVAEPPSSLQVSEYEVVTEGPDIPDTVNTPPVQDVALIELHDRVEDWPGLILVGLADSEAVVAGGGAVNDPGVQGVNEP